MIIKKLILKILIALLIAVTPLGIFYLANMIFIMFDCQHYDEIFKRCSRIQGWPLNLINFSQFVSLSFVRPAYFFGALIIIVAIAEFFIVTIPEFFKYRKNRRR